MTIATLMVDVLANTASLDRNVKQVNSTLDSITSAAKTVGSALGIAFSVGEVVSLVRDITDFASHMNDLSAQTGIGVEQLQALDYAASGSGVQIDQLANAISQMSKRLASDQASAVPALRDLHLNLSQLMQMSPDQAFLAIATAIAKIPNPMQQSADAIALFGKSGAQLLPLLKDNIADLTEEAMRNGAVVSKDLIDKADELDDAWHRLVIRGKALLADVVIPLASEAPGIARAWAVISNPGGGSGGERLLSTAELLERAAKTAPQLQMVGEALPKAVPSAEIVHRLEQQAAGLEKTAKAASDAAIAEARLFTAQMENNQKYWDMVTKLERDMLDVRRDLETKFAEDQQRIAETAGQKLIETTLQINNSLISIDAERTRNLLAMNVPQGVATTVKAATDGTLREVDSFGSKLLDSLKGHLGGLNSIFQAAFTGGGGALGAVKSFATQTLSTVLGLIPGVGPILSQFSGLFVAAFGKIASAFSGIFGGPSKDEKAGRSASDAFTQQLAGMLDWMQQIEVHQLVAAGNSEKWATQVVAIRDAYIKAGHSVDDALAMVDRLWKAEKQGGNAVQQVIDEITRSMHDTLPAAAGVTEAAGVAAFDGIADAARNAGDVAAEQARRTAAQWADIQRMYGVTLTGGEGTSEGRNESNILSGYSSDDAKRIYETQIAPGSTDQDWDRVHGQYGFAGGTGGAFRDFGAGTPVMLHGRERVMTEAEGRGDTAVMTRIETALRELPRQIKIAMRDGLRGTA